MLSEHNWNHNNYAVPAQNLDELERCLDALFGWEKLVNRPEMLGYKLKQDYRRAMVFFQPAEPATRLASALERLRKGDAELDEALRGYATISPEVADHNGMMLPTVAEWEKFVAHACRLAEEHPEWQITIPDVYRPGQPNAITDTLHQCWVRIGLLGPVRNTFEVQAAAGT
jgi:hypothetical protein